MKIGLRILLGYFVIVALAAWLLGNVFVQQVKPGVRQAMEDTLADTANVLAELAKYDAVNGQALRRMVAAGAELRSFTLTAVGGGGDFKLTENTNPWAVRNVDEGGIERRGRNVHVKMAAIRSHFAPDNLEGIQVGDTVMFHLTNIEQDWDVVHGFAVLGAENAELIIGEQTLPTLGQSVLAFLARYLDVATTIWEEKGTQRASTILEYLFPRTLVSTQTLDTVDAWLESSDANPAAKRYVREGRADIARALAAQAKDAG